MTHLVDFAPLAHFTESSGNWTDILISRAHQLASDSNMSFAEALNMPISFEAMYYKSQAWQNTKQAEEYKQKIQGVVIKQLNHIIKGIGVLAKSRY